MVGRFAFTVASGLVLGALPSALGHAMVTTPPSRKPGAKFGEACGSTALSIASSDQYGNIQNYEKTAPSTCAPSLCKGFVFEDQDASNVQSFTVGQVVPIVVDLRAPHGGPANMKVVNTKEGAAGTPIGDSLISWDLYGSTSRPISKNDTNFEVTIPDLGGACTTAGECVLQWTWENPDIDQTYLSCVDFTVGGGSGSGQGGNTGGNGDSTPSSSGSAATGSKTARPFGSVSASASASASASSPSATNGAGGDGSDDGSDDGDYEWVC